MSDTHKHKRAQRERQKLHAESGFFPKGNSSPDFDGRRYGNKRKAVAELKRKDRRRTNRANRRNLLDYDTPFNKKYRLE